MRSAISLCEQSTWQGLDSFKPIFVMDRYEILRWIVTGSTMLAVSLKIGWNYGGIFEIVLQNSGIERSFAAT
jgi:Zn-dependent protease